MHSSPSLRARETATLLGLPRSVEPCPALDERNWGTWFAGVEGGAASVRRAEAARLARADPWGWRPEGGESLREVRERVDGWLTAVLGGLRAGALIAVTHGEAMLAARTVVEPAWRVQPLPLPGGAGHTVPNGAALLYEFDDLSVIAARRTVLADPLAAPEGASGLRWEELARGVD